MNAESQLHWCGYSVAVGTVDDPRQLASNVAHGLTS